MKEFENLKINCPRVRSLFLTFLLAAFLIGTPKTALSQDSSAQLSCTDSVTVLRVLYAKSIELNNAQEYQLKKRDELVNVLAYQLHAADSTMAYLVKSCDEISRQKSRKARIRGVTFGLGIGVAGLKVAEIIIGSK